MDALTPIASADGKIAVDSHTKREIEIDLPYSFVSAKIVGEHIGMGSTWTLWDGFYGTVTIRELS